MASLTSPEFAKKLTLSDGTTYGYVHIPPSSAPSTSPSPTTTTNPNPKRRKPTFLLIHGAPSSSYIWHHQINRLAKAGFGVLAPDLLGYGDSDCPEVSDAMEGLEKYHIKNVVPQVRELISRVVFGDDGDGDGCDDDERVIGVGHDLGSPLLSHLYVHHKEIFSGLVFIAVGFVIVDGKLDYGMFLSFFLFICG